MLIRAKVIYKDEKQSDLLGKEIIEGDEIQFNLNDCNGIIPQKQKNRYVIVLSGSEFLIETNENILGLWQNLKTKI